REQGRLVFAEEPIGREIQLAERHLLFEGPADFAIALDEKDPGLVPRPAVAQLHELLYARVSQAGDFVGGPAQTGINHKGTESTEILAGNFDFLSLRVLCVLRASVVKKKKTFNDHPFAYHQEIELEIVTLTNLGSGLGRVALDELKAESLKLK